MNKYILNIVGHSADLKTAPTGSKDTGIFFPQDLIDFLGHNEDYSFTIYKEDCFRALSSIISSLPLYSNKGGKKVTHSDVNEEFTRLYSMISSYFGNDNTAVYSGFNLTETTGGRRYLYGLEQQGFSLRKLLIADNSILIFQKDEEERLTLRFKTAIARGQEKLSLEKPKTVEEKDNNSSTNLYLTALRTKPFILLAGISGTGKSRIVREFAFKSCPKYLQDKDGTTPGNYCMIEVKPNWHDSTELLGYYSRLGKGGYQFTKFVKFLVKAKMFPKVPFFVCLDEMNLAPVEQYFAELLSILETRKHPKGAPNTIKTEPIIDARYFKELEEMKGMKDSATGIPFTNTLTDRDIYLKLYGLDTENDIEEEVGNRHDLTTEGLTLPDNVFIIGTVNMDDTTHQFSRKVIDRAMTIEMNGGRLANIFGGSKNLEYLPDEQQKEWQDAFKQSYVTADEVIDAHPDEGENLIKTLPNRLEEINAILKSTPFEVSYRVLNELTIMVGVMLDDTKEQESLDDIINQAVNNILLMKILPRIEGDAEMFALSKKFKEENGITYNDRLEWLQELAPTIHSDEEEDNHQQTAKEKIKEMRDRLENQEFTRFWP